MALLWVILVERLSSLADLLDHAVGLVLLDEPLDPRVVVAGDDHEAVALFDDLPVIGGTELERLEARVTVAFAVEWERGGDVVQLAPFVDPLVDTAKHFLVPGRPVRKVHDYADGGTASAASILAKAPASASSPPGAAAATDLARSSTKTR